MIPVRKSIRLKDYDYSENGAYFVTICTHEKQHIFWNVGAIIDRPRKLPELTPLGLIAEKFINRIPEIYPNIFIEKYTVMPNHVHILLSICKTADTQCGRPVDAPTIQRIIQQYKGSVTKEAGILVWQKSFHEHIVRDEQEYLHIWQYIDENPLKLEQDCYYDT